jgi:hypothetical protein
MLEEDDELSASDCHWLIARKFDMRIPVPTIRRILRLKLQWVIVRARTGPMFSKCSKRKRGSGNCFDFATKCISDKDFFPFRDMINSFANAPYDFCSTPAMCHLIEFSRYLVKYSHVYPHVYLSAHAWKGIYKFRSPLYTYWPHFSNAWCISISIE